MASTKVEFKNGNGQIMAGRLELPEGRTKAFSIFAHCFTCSKDVAAATRITRALSRAGFGVLRFDFTGLGNSDGDFSNTNFSSNVEDLVSASAYLAQHYAPAAILVGHSLGGAAVLIAGERIDSVKAIVTIGAPADPHHVIQNFHADIENIERDGEAEVKIAGRKFKIKKQFLDDLRDQASSAKIRNLKRSLLLFHSPQDEIVGIENAQKIYESARHPKSFVSLDKADHLLSEKKDSEYVASIIASWAERYI